MQKDLIKKLICLVYPLLTVIYLAYLFFDAVRPGVCMSAVLLLSAAFLFPAGCFTVKTPMDKVFAAYLAFNLLSGIWCMYYGIPFSVYAGEVSTTALPMFFYYAGRSFDEAETALYYKGYLAASLGMGFIGVILYILAPQFYLDFSYDNLFISVADVPTSRVRMNSLIGSGAMAVFATYALCISSFFFKNSKKKQKIAGFVCLALSLVFAFMANQRSSMFCIILVLLFFILEGYLAGGKRSKKTLWIEIGIAAAAVAGVFVFARGVFEKFYARLASIPEGFGERSETWVAAVNDMKNMWLGDGLGSRGHRAAPFRTYIVADGGLVKLYTEMGIIGTSLIIFLLVLVFLKAVKKPSAVIPEITVIVCAILMSIGSNVLEMQICAPIVYFALGRAVRILNE
ncbi:MAG: hypothetical protein J5829_03215 [Lachnospiraceae bacterium]|nr:hypothetical protein [Lachnospiraceae bacterium]